MWEYQAKKPVLSEDELELGYQASFGSMSARFAASREILGYDYQNWDRLRRCSQCGERYPCQDNYCDKCFLEPLDPNAWRVDPAKFISADVVNPVYYPRYVGKGAYRHIKRITGILEPFYGLPVAEIVPATIKLCYLQGGEDYAAVIDFYAARMREIAVQFRQIVHPGVRLKYRFERSWTTAGQAKWDLPLRGPGIVDVKTMDPDQVVALLHVHCIAHFPGFHHSEAGDIFRMMFDGPWQVHVSTPRPDKIVGEYCGRQDGLRLGDLVLSDDANDAVELLLPDHPEDRLIPECLEHAEATLQKEMRHVDLCLNILADLYDQQTGSGDYETRPEDIERKSGLVGFASYICKEDRKSVV